MKPFISFLFFITIVFCAQAQKYKSFKRSPKGDTLNAITQDDKKIGKWVIHVDELRGEPGYEEEGVYSTKGEKDGVWRKYNLQGDIIGVENYKNGGKDGIQQYFTPLGDLVREESWKGYDPENPYDTIPIYGTGSGEILDYKIVKAEPYSVKHGEWKFYDPSTGELIKKEEYNLNVLVVPKPKTEEPVVTKKREVPKTAEMLEWEKKNSGKKKALREGRTCL